MRQILFKIETVKWNPKQFHLRTSPRLLTDLNMAKKVSLFIRYNRKWFMWYHNIVVKKKKPYSKKLWMKYYLNRIVGHFIEYQLLTGKVEVGHWFLASRAAARAVDSEKMVITPQKAIAVTEQHSRYDGRPVQKARRASQRFHKQLSIFNYQLTVLGLNT